MTNRHTTKRFYTIVFLDSGPRGLALVTQSDSIIAAPCSIERGRELARKAKRAFFEDAREMKLAARAEEL